MCHCDDGYKQDPQYPLKCIEVDCIGHGHVHGITDSECHCDDGYEQDPQDVLQCIPMLEEDCGEHGHRHGTECHCDDGYEVDPKGSPTVCVETLEECSGHGHTHGDWCHCDGGFIMEPADPMRCSFGLWDPCATAFETGEFDLRTTTDLVNGASLVGIDVQDNVLVMVTLHSDRGIEIIDVNGKFLQTPQDHPQALGSFGVTVPRKIRGNHLVGYILENGSTFEGAYGFRYDLQTEEYELFDPYTELNINTTGWSYLDQGLTDENENGDLISYYYNSDLPGYKGFIVKEGNYSRLEVPGTTGHVFPWTFAGTDRWAGRARFNSTWNPAHWIHIDGTGVQVVAPFGSTLASIDDAVVTEKEGFTGIVGYYRDPNTDDLDFSDQIRKGFVGDTKGNYHSISFPNAQATLTMVQGVTGRCTIAGGFTDSVGNSGTFIGIPKEVGRH